MKIKISIAVFIFFILSNYAPLNLIFHTFTNEGYYQYSNYNGSNTIEEGVHKGYGLALMKRLHQAWINENPQAPDKKLYRIFWKNPLAFWRWKGYFKDERYELPFKDWNEIKMLREKNKSTIKQRRKAF